MQNNKKNNFRVIALYLPQFHPTNSNNKWWGKGFTEWTNVCKAKKLFPGHKQPHVPADLGFYDLRLPETREAQAKMAKNYGIEGFCYYHYWFGNDKQELELPFNEVLNSTKPDFPFCLCWANESWYAKMWDNDGSVEKKELVKQTYTEVDHIKHFNFLLPAFKDKRYICVNEKPLFMIYQPLDLPGTKSFIKLWQDLAIQNGLKGIYFIAHTRRMKKEGKINLKNGFDAINVLRLNEAMRKSTLLKKVSFKVLKTIIKTLPRICYYKDVYPFFIAKEEKQNNIFPCIIPNWDHTPRSGSGGTVLYKSNPKLFRKHVDQVLETSLNKSNDEKIIFIKSWNEWGEGNYMEPDLEYGKAYLQELKNSLDSYS